MHSNIRSLRNISVAALAGMLMGAPAHADDTEIYIGTNAGSAGTVDPNVMFVIDTSGSMGSSVTNVIAPYNPNTNYGGSCNSNRIYWSTSGSVPSCSTSRYISKSSFRCAAADTPLFGTSSTSTGIYQDRVARFFESGRRRRIRRRWLSLSTNDQSPTHVECRADETIHGGIDFDDPAGSEPKRIGQVSGGYTSSTSNDLNWASTGAFTTLYSANYMNYFNSSGNIVNTNRITIVKDVVNAIIDSNTNLNIALMRFDTNSFTSGRNRGGPIIYPFSDIDATGVRTAFKAEVTSLNATGNTPLAETLLEAARIYRGEKAESGLAPPNNIPSVPTAFVSGSNVYDTPLDVQCQKNFIIYLTDGAPTSDFEFDTDINNLISNAALPSGDTTCGGSDNCMDELAEYLNEVDQISTLNGKQNVVTYTIGFFSNQTLLSNAATKGGGTYYLADNFAALSDAFTQIITEIQAVNSTFTAPAVSVNAFNRITNRKELYFTLFKPRQEPIWTGNLKRYELDFLKVAGVPVDTDGDGIPDPPQILDANGAAAVDPQTGFFDINSTSYWTQSADSPDGDSTALGGAARLFGSDPNNIGADDPAKRKVYTYTGKGTVNLGTDAENHLVSGTKFCPGCADDDERAGLLGTNTLATDPDFQELTDWRAGRDVQDEDADGSENDARRTMADPLHTKPLLVTYGSTQANPDIVLYMASNDGSIHAIDVDDGTEVFSYIPPDQLERSQTYFDNQGSGTKEYGLDGNLTLFHKDLNGDGILDSGEQYILVVGQRRGGTRYYALDITERNNPKYLWTIVGGQSGAVPNPGGTGVVYLDELSQTWGTARIGRITIGSTNYDVAIFGGGYEAGQDVEGVARTADTAGRAIYMVNIYTGALLWWAGPPVVNPGDPDPNLDLAAMEFSIAADVKVIDINGDGFTDRLYAADMGGQIWRFDVENGAASADDLVFGTVHADLQLDDVNDTETIANNRKFFYAPDVSLVVPEDDPPYLAIAIGSGNRAHPLNTDVQDRFFMVKDVNPFSRPVTSGGATNYPATVYNDDLVDTTLNLSPTIPGTKSGWYLQLTNGTTISSLGSFVGEKVLSESVTFDGRIMFTSFSPVGGTSSSSCAPNQGTGSVFVIDVENAAPVQDLDSISSSTTFTRTDRALTLVRTGIAPEVTILFPPLENVDPVALVAAEQLDLELNNPPVKTYWFQQEEN